MKRIRTKRAPKNSTAAGGRDVDAARDVREEMIKKRRDFFLSVLSRLQQDHVPDEIRTEMRAFARSQLSEVGILDAIDCSVDELRAVIEFLLLPTNLCLTNLGKPIREFLQDRRANDEIERHGAGEATVEGYDNRLWLRLARYARESLSTHIPGSGGLVDTPIDQVEKDLHKLFVPDNPFASIFGHFIPEDVIKSFLVAPHTDEGVRVAIHRFIREHSFDLIFQAFDLGFQPRSFEDWVEVFPRGFLDRFPPVMWKLTKVEDFRALHSAMMKTSFPIEDFVHAYLALSRKNLRLLDPVPRRVPSPAPPRRAINELRVRNTGLAELIERTRPEIERHIAVLIEPLDNDLTYTAQRYKGTPYFYPTDAFFHDLVRNPVEQPRDVLSIMLSNFDPPRVRRVRVAHLLDDGRIEPQTHSMFLKSRQRVDTDETIQIPHVIDHMLSLPLGSLSARDLTSLRDHFRKSISILLTDIFIEKLDTDSIASEIEDTIAATSESLRHYLSRVFNVVLLIDPRYGMRELFPGIVDRLNMFYYRLETIGDLPVDFYYPQNALLEDTSSFVSWRDTACRSFCTASIMRVLRVYYPFLRVTVQVDVVRGFKPVYKPHQTESFTLLVPYKGKFLFLPDVARAILQQEELSATSKTFLDNIAVFFDLDRVKDAFAAILDTSGFEIQEETATAPSVLRLDVSTDLPAVEENLPGFRARAFALLDRL